MWVYMFGQLWWPDWPGLVPWAGAVGDALGPTSGAGVGVAPNAAIENATTGGDCSQRACQQ